jgi:hypothetical protein
MALLPHAKNAAAATSYIARTALCGRPQFGKGSDGGYGPLNEEKFSYEYWLPAQRQAPSLRVLVYVFVFFLFLLLVPVSRLLEVLTPFYFFLAPGS